MDRFFERAFNKVHAQVNAVQSVPPPNAGNGGEQQPPEPEVKNAIQAILLHWRNKEYFKLIQLPEPTADELGRPTWACTPADVSRAYRKLSVLVHPDKVEGDEAREAFEALNQAHRILKDPSQLEEVLKVAGARARREKERADAAAAVDSSSRAALASSKNQEIKRLRQEQGREFQDTILEQMKRRQDEAKRKAEALKRARSTVEAEEQRRREEEEKEREREQEKQQQKGASKGPGKQMQEESSDEEGAQRRRQAAAMRKKKKPTFM
ncbi:DnaJ-like protein [Dunaliella salina]|uniref:DnaJ-like protein n=1 Tax=Dunaliella salina TaxID=3046 RepID=A0ABQ7GYD7_DUNSA|nr:DnaJ-like protein [Dunaliella salina]|eukprot:KAF5839613.1 DnaJ-like protein [Dunaliella salina]